MGGDHTDGHIEQKIKQRIGKDMCAAVEENDSCCKTCQFDHIDKRHHIIPGDPVDKDGVNSDNENGAGGNGDQHHGERRNADLLQEGGSGYGNPPDKTHIAEDGHQQERQYLLPLSGADIKEPVEQGR